MGYYSYLVIPDEEEDKEPKQKRKKLKKAAPNPEACEAVLFPLPTPTFG